MLLRLFWLGLLLFGVFVFQSKMADKDRRRRILRLLGKGERSFADLSRALGHPRWLAHSLARLRDREMVAVTLPTDFDRKRPREEQVRYRLGRRAPMRGF